MYQISDGCKKAINHYSRELYSKAYIDNEEIYEGDIISYEMNEGIISGSDFELGGAVASTLEIKINNLHGAYDNLELNGKEIKLLTGILLENNTIDYVQMGVFIIDEVVKDKSIINIEAADKMVTLEDYYESKLTFPTSVLNIANEICTTAGITLATKQFYNSNYIVDSLPTGITLRDVIHDIAEIAGGFAKINRVGELEIITPATTVATEINKDRYIDLQIKEGFYVDKLTIVENYFPVDPVPINLNILPFTSKWQGDFSLDCGDKVRLNNGKGTYETIITKQKITFNGGLRYESECTGLSDQQKNTQQISNTEKTNKRYRSEIKQLADEIALKVSSGDFEAYQKITDKKIESKVTAITGDITSLQHRVDTAEQKITPTAITATISNTINDGSGSIETTQFIMDINGFTINNGAFKIRNKKGTTVLQGDSNGNLKLSIFDSVFEMSATGERKTTMTCDVLDKFHLKVPYENQGAGFLLETDTGLKLIEATAGTDYLSIPTYTKISSLTVNNAASVSDFSIKKTRMTHDSNGKFTMNIPFDLKNEGFLLKTSRNTNLIEITAGGNGALNIPIWTVISELSVSNEAYVAGNFSVSGSKNCLHKTEHYGDRLINAYETAEYYFGDLGFGTINGNGECLINIDDIFAECVNTDIKYHVFTQVYNGSIESIERYSTYFIVKGVPDTEFSWELKAKRKGYENVRLDVQDISTVGNLEVKTVENTLLDILDFKLEDILLMEE